MKRTPLKRSTPLRRSGSLKRSGMKRGKALRRRLKTLDWETRAQVRYRARGRCERCGISEERRGMQVHHKRLRSQGGSDELTNLAMLCVGPKGCHGVVHANPARSYAEGWIIPAGVPT